MTDKLTKEFEKWRDAEIDENWSHIPSIKYRQKILKLMGAAYLKGRDDRPTVKPMGYAYCRNCGAKLDWSKADVCETRKK